MRSIQAELLDGEALYRAVILQHVQAARKSVWIATANVKAMMIEREGRFVPIVDLFSDLEKRGVSLRLLHAEMPSRPFRKFFDRRSKLVSGGLALKLCPRVHFKCVIVDGAWVYLGSANLTGAGLGAKSDGKRNFELGFVTDDFDTIDRVSAMFEAVWGGDECRSCALHRVCPDPIGAGPERKSKRKRGAGGGPIALGRARKLPRAMDQR